MVTRGRSGAFFKDVARDLRKSAGRFGGMFAIVALGVFMYAGLGSTGELMQHIGDTYFDGRNFMDIRVVSTFGLNEKDMDALRSVDGVESAAGAYVVDAFAVSASAQVNTKVHSLRTGEGRAGQVNLPQLLSGRYPERGDEALAEPELLRLLGLEVGDTVRLQSGRSPDIRTKLRTDRFRIVGTARSPLYFSTTTRGSSSIGTGQAEAYLLIPEESFRLTTYSEAYITVTGARELDTYGDAYKEQIDAVTDWIEQTGDERAPERKAEATRRAWEAISQAEASLTSASAQSQTMLADALAELLSGGAAISGGRLELAQAEIDLNDSYRALEHQRLVAESALAQLEAGLSALRASKSSMRAQRIALHEAEKELRTAQTAILQNKRDALTSLAAVDEGLSAVLDGLMEADRLMAEADFGIAALQSELQRLETDYAAATTTAERDAIQAQIDQANIELADLQAQAAEIKTRLAELERQYSRLVNSEDDLDEAFHALRTARRSWVQNLLQLEESSRTLLSGEAALDSLIAAAQLQKVEAADGMVEIERTGMELDAAAESVQRSRRDLIESNTALRDAKAEFASRQAAAQKELAAAGEILAQQRELLKDLDDPKWYVLDRDTNSGFGGYSGESKQVGDIGTFLPLLFFLVAALVSLTTMTRLVEEQRTSMGTYKALGYGGPAILSRYLLYAAAPSGLGALAGGALGLAFFPRIILDGAFASMYYIPAYQPEINMTYLLGGIALAVVSTAGPTFLTCREALREAPAVLMRPKSPRVGRKTPLEYCGFFWRRLSFLYKITFRNIFRYKKRLFMTLAGVGGSTALLLTGFGLNDSVENLVDAQYGGLFRYDMTISFADDASGSVTQRVRKELSESPAVSAQLFLHEEAVELHTGDGATQDAVLIAVEPEALADFTVLRERIGHTPVLPGGDGMVLTEWVAGHFEAVSGSQLVVRDEDDDEFNAEVAAVCESYIGNAIYMTPEYYEAVSGKNFEANTIYAVRTSGAAQADLEALSEEILELDGVSAVAFTADTAQTYKDMMSAMMVVIGLIIGIAAVLAFVVLANLTNINIAERTREIATIEVLGFRDGEASAYIYRENFIVTFAAALIGLGLGVPLHRYLCRSIEGDGMMFLRDISPLSFFLSVAATMLFAVVVTVATSGKLKKINMIEALKSAE